MVEVEEERVEEQAASRGASGALLACIEQCALLRYLVTMFENGQAELQSRQVGWQIS